MVTDNRLLDEVRAVLHAEVADVVASPAVLAEVRRGLRRRRVVRRWLAPVPVAAAAAAVLALPPAAEEPPAVAVNAAHVTTRALSALDEVTDHVVYERATVTEGDKYSAAGEPALYERWLAADGGSFRLRVTIAGAPVVDMSRDRVSDVFVDHRARTYLVHSGVEPGDPAYDDVWTPAEIQNALRNGELTVVGASAPVNGRPAVLLHRTTRKADVGMKLWVDAVTYLPVRWEREQENSAPFDVTYLPPTAANRARLTTIIPSGFTEEK